jgi:hypothetical protein
MSIKFNEVTWYSKLGAVILFLLVVPILTFYIGREYEATVIALKEAGPVTAPVKTSSTAVHQSASIDPLNATYFIDDEQVTLVNGVAEESVVPGSAAKLETHVFGAPVYGDLNGDGQQDAILFLYQETPGTGVFFYVAAMTSQNGSAKTTNTIFLGDRVAPQNIAIANGVAAVNYIVRRDAAPMTEAPSVGVTKYVKVKGGELVEESAVE